MQGTRLVLALVLSRRAFFLCVTLNYPLTPQGLMFGYATDETEECMPLTIVLAHKLNAKMAELRRNGTLPWLRPDSKTQVGLSLLVVPIKYPWLIS